LVQLLTGHRISFNTPSKNYLFLFKDSVISRIDNDSYSWVANQDILNNYIFYDSLPKKKLFYEPNDTLERKYIISIWDFKSLKHCRLEDVFINTNVVLGKSKFFYEETPDSEGPNPISIKTLYKINGMIMNFDVSTQILKEYHSKNCKGIYGLMNKVEICNKFNEPQIYINYKNKNTPSILLLYKGKDGFYLIIIMSTGKFDESITRILNLK
jgi:hypothetical protein